MGTPVSSIPVIAIDGPTASGKGTVAAAVARELGFHLLDSGALYRLVALDALNRGVALDDEPALTALAADLDTRFEPDRILLRGVDVSKALRAETTGNAASTIAVLQGVRTALLERQRAFREPPGLVADGRDMAAVIFPDAVLKIFLTATIEERARRRYKQLIEKGLPANIESLTHEIEARDARDSLRPVAPLKPVSDAVILETTKLSIHEAVEFVVASFRARVPTPSGT